MFGEVCARANEVVYRGTPNMSAYFYTWKETKDYAWDTSETSWNNIVVMEGELGNHTNMNSVEKSATDYSGESNLPNSNNALLSGNNYHKPDYSKWNNFSVIAFPMHWNFRTAAEAFGVKSGDKHYNDATYNVVYVDSHDYAPDGAPESVRFNQDEDVWAENSSLMFTFRGIPCIYYGSEIQFMKGAPIDKGPNGPLSATGRAYYGGYIKGDITATDFAEYSASGNANATLNHPLALHFQRLNQIRMAVPALRKGQYSTDGCNGSFAFKRRYTDDKTDSFVLVCISGGATFSNIPDGKYTDVVTGDVKNVTNGSLSVSCSGKGNLRAYVLDTDKTKAPGKVGKDGKYLYGSASVNPSQPGYDGSEDEESGNNGGGTGGTGGSSEPEIAIDPCVAKGEKCVFFQRPSNWGKTIMLYIWKDGVEPLGGWAGKPMQNLGNGNYKMTFNGDYSGYNFIFHDGANGKTADLSDLKLSAMYDSNGKVVKTIAEGDCEAGPGTGDNPEDAPVTPPVVPSINPGEQCVFFQNNQGWSTVYCYVWYKDANGTHVDECGAWPGSACESVGNNIYKYCFDKTIGQPTEWGLIFNNGAGTQTGDFVAKNATMYDFDGNTTTVDVEDVYALNVDVYAYNRVIYVDNAEGRVITVRSLDGRVIYSGIDTMIPVNNAGIYLVTVEDATLKIMVK